jgi:hypothetical protein
MLSSLLSSSPREMEIWKVRVVLPLVVILMVAPQPPLVLHET